MVTNAQFREKGNGSVNPGKLADIGGMDDDLFAIEPAKPRDSRVIATIVGGKVVFSAK